MQESSINTTSQTLILCLSLLYLLDRRLNTFVDLLHMSYSIIPTIVVFGRFVAQRVRSRSSAHARLSSPVLEVFFCWSPRWGTLQGLDFVGCSGALRS